MNELKEIAIKHTTENSFDYIDVRQVDTEKSYYIQSKHNINGSALIYQHVVMLDGSVYNLKSWSASMRGIVAYHCHGKELTQREVKSHFNENTINY